VSQYADVDAYNERCPGCGLWRFEHTPTCPEMRAFDSDAALYDDDDAAPDDREVPVPFDQSCPLCAQYKEPDNHLCDSCWEREGGSDHA
jgi:hypothetical protein